MGDNNESEVVKVHHIKYKKNDGYIVVSTKKVGWIAEGMNGVAVYLSYTDIKSKYCIYLSKNNFVFIHVTFTNYCILRFQYFSK